MLTLAAFEIKIFSKCISKIFISIIGVKMTLRIIKKNICSRFSDTVSHKIDFMAFDLNRDHPPAWELNYLDNRKKIL